MNDWWQASDGNWYPPHLHPAYQQQAMVPMNYYGTQPTNTLGTAGGVVGIIAIVLSFIPLIGIISWILAPVGLIISAIALTRQPRGMAITGLVTSGFALLVCLAWVSIFVN